MKTKCPFRSLGARSKNCPYMFGGDCKDIEIGPENGDSWCRVKIETTDNKSASVTGLGADADYAYKNIEEFEAIIECKVNDAFKDGWKMARATNKQLRALAGEEAGP